MHSLSWVRSAAAVISDATPLGGPSTGSGDVSISTVVRCYVAMFYVRSTVVPSYRRTVVPSYDYLLLNWNRLRAPARPGFLRSTTRGSRVNKIGRAHV